MPSLICKETGATGGGCLRDPYWAFSFGRMGPGDGNRADYAYVFKHMSGGGEAWKD